MNLTMLQYVMPPPRRLLARHYPAFLQRRLKEGELALEVLVPLQDGGGIAAPAFEERG
jgi:hypothetical protein